MAANRGGKSTQRSEFESLDPAHQVRIRRTLRIAGVWFGAVIVSATIFILAKPYMKRRRLERMKQPGYVPSAVLREPPNKENVQGVKKSH